MLTFRGATVGLGSAMATATNGEVRSLGGENTSPSQPLAFYPTQRGGGVQGVVIQLEGQIEAYGGREGGSEWYLGKKRIESG